MEQAEQYTYEIATKSNEMCGVMKKLSCHAQDGRWVYEHELEYIRNEDGPQYLQLIYPVYGETMKKKQLPCVFYATATNYSDTKPVQNLPALVNWAQRGYVVAIIHQTKEIEPALKFLTGMTSYHVNPNQLIIWENAQNENATIGYYHNNEITPVMKVHNGPKYWTEEFLDLIEDTIISHI